MPCEVCRGVRQPLTACYYPFISLTTCSSTRLLHSSPHSLSQQEVKQPQLLLAPVEAVSVPLPSGPQFHTSRIFPRL
ncbi:MAG: hypothetical protein LM590_08010 [Thermofilum sp.]|nr:hypothetical protein [Thermofilum sp.]